MTSARYGKHAFAPRNTRPTRSWLLLFCLAISGVSAAFEMEMGTVTINDTFTSPTWTSVTFAQAFPTVPVVVSLATNQGSDPANVRIRNVTTTGFEILQTEPSANDGLHVAMDTAYLAIETGTHTLPNGQRITALLHSTTQTISAGSGGGWDTIALSPGFPAAPAVVTSLQTTRNESANPPSTSSVPFIGVAVRNVAATSLQVSIERAESPSGTVSIPEDIGIIALDSAIDTSFLDVLGTTIAFQAFVTPNNIQGWGNGCFSNFFSTAFSTTPVTVASANTRAGGNGGWLRRCALTSSTIGLTVDEDIDSDSERNHISETGGVVAASTAFHAVFNVNLTVSKSALTIEDDINGTVDPKAIPNARVEYAITTENSGIKSPDSDSLIVTDDLPEETALCVTAACNPGGPVVLDTSASPFPPGVTLDTANIRYSNDDGATFSYTPIPDADGFDPAVDAMQVPLSGALATRTASGTPEFTLRLVVRVE